MQHRIDLVLALALTLVLALGLSHQARAASFNCAKASSAVERLVCGDAELSGLDDHLGQYYAGARLANPLAAACLQAEQRSWLRQNRDTCSNTGCLQRAYLTRLAELHPLQPGATAIRYRTLPDVPALAWLLPPDPDSAKAPGTQARQALVLRGRIVNDVAHGEGYVLQEASGRRTTVLALMFIDAAQGAALDALAREPGTVFEVRGLAEQAPNEPVHYAQGACVAIYRLPR